MAEVSLKCYVLNTALACANRHTRARAQTHTHTHTLIEQICCPSAHATDTTKQPIHSRQCWRCYNFNFEAKCSAFMAVPQKHPPSNTIFSKTNGR